MTRGRTPTLHCDGEDGDCGAWEVDYWGADVSSVNGIRVTRDNRAPGWVSTDSGDWCAEHSGEAKP